LRHYLNPKVIISCLLAVFIACLGFVYLLAQLSKPAVGVVNLSPEEESSSNNEQNPVIYNGKYLSFTAPMRYRILNTPLSGTYLEAVGLYSTDRSQISVAIGVSQESLEMDTGVILRRDSPQTYKTLSQSDIQVDFESTNNGQNGYERDEFIAHNNLVVSIVLTAPNQEVIANDFSTIINSFKWH
jgi:hypothetical protein